MATAAINAATESPAASTRGRRCGADSARIGCMGLRYQRAPAYARIEMAGRAARSRRNQVAAATAARPPASSGTAVHRDIRRWIYAGLDLLFATAYAVAI